MKKWRELSRKEKIMVCVGGGGATVVVGFLVYGLYQNSISCIDVESSESPVLIHNINNTIKSSPKTPHTTSKHIRNLPTGHCASPEKIATAKDNGFELNENQTWVETYHTGKKIA